MYAVLVTRIWTSNMTFIDFITRIQLEKTLNKALVDVAPLFRGLLSKGNGCVRVCDLVEKVGKHFKKKRYHNTDNMKYLIEID